MDRLFEGFTTDDKFYELMFNNTNELFRLKTMSMMISDPIQRQQYLQSLESTEQNMIKIYKMLKAKKYGEQP